MREGDLQHLSLAVGDVMNFESALCLFSKEVEEGAFKSNSLVKKHLTSKTRTHTHGCIIICNHNRYFGSHYIAVYIAGRVTPTELAVTVWLCQVQQLMFFLTATLCIVIYTKDCDELDNSLNEKPSITCT